MWIPACAGMTSIAGMTGLIWHLAKEIQISHLLANIWAYRTIAANRANRGLTFFAKIVKKAGIKININGEDHDKCSKIKTYVRSGSGG